jgi:type IV pilus assembly protein PilV
MMISLQNKMMRRHAGVSLIEILVTLVLISLALLGSASLQVLSKRSNHGSMQRTIAAQLASDYLERVRSNKSALEDYVLASDIGGSTVAVPGNDCLADNANCTDSQMATFDVWQWEQHLDGNSELEGDTNSGGLLMPTACIDGPAAGAAGVYEVSIAWRGLSEHVDPILDDCGSASGKYGDNNEFRHVLVMRTFVNTN